VSRVALVWLAAALLYYPVARIWFLSDDFAWLGLRFLDLKTALFQPFAQGTVRVLSERLYFLTLPSLFGVSAIPFRLAACATLAANIWLAARIGGRLSGSAPAGALAALLWAMNARLATPMAWASSYNQLLLAFVVLLALELRARYLDSGRRGFAAGEALVFLAGFGVLETVVVYPAIAALYTWFARRDRFRESLWLFVPAAAFAVFHLFAIPKKPSEIYQPVFAPASLLATAWRYTHWALGPERLAEAVSPLWRWPQLAIKIATGAAVLAALACRRDRLALFGAAHFLLFLAPVLPLANHRSAYYLTLPVLGLAWAAAPVALRFPARALPLIAVYLIGHTAEVRATLAWYRLQTHGMRTLMRAVERTHRAHPDVAILLAGVDRDLFESGFQDEPFRLYGVKELYLAPGTETAVRVRDDLGSLERWRLPLARAAERLAAGTARVLVNAGGAWRDETARYRTIVLAETAPRRIEVAAPGFAARLGGTWHAPENGFRWMGRSATVQVSGPGERLAISGYAPRLLVPVTLRVQVDGRPVAERRLTTADAPFTLEAACRIGREARIELQVDRVRRVAGDGRELGLIVSAVEVR
jgi:hypothetical protein